MSDGKPICFTVGDFVKGCTPAYLLNLLEDVRFRDSGCKVAQYTLKLGASLIGEETLCGSLDAAARKKTVADYNTAAALLSTARRCFRFVRWLKNVNDFVAGVKSEKDARFVPVKIAHLAGGVVACVCEDITTLGRLQLIPQEVANRFVWLGNAGWFTESLFGLVLTLRALQADVLAFKQARDAYKAVAAADARGGQAAPSSDALRAAAQAVFAARVKVHFGQIAAIKWACETFAATHDLEGHTYTKLAYLASLVSASVSTYAQASKTWPSAK